MSELPLVVDLDGTLIRSDLLVESASWFVLHSPFRAWRLARWFRGGHGAVRQEVAAAPPLDPETLPYNAALVSWLRDERAAGRRLYLSSASDPAHVTAVANHLGIFTEVFASLNGATMGSETKRDLFVEQFGAAGFEYVGSHRDDLPVWSSAAVAHVVVGSNRLLRRIRSVSTLGLTFNARTRSRLAALWTVLRPYQWAKNGLVLVPVVTAQLLGSASAVVASVLAAIAFCLASSSVYVLNDLADIEYDRHHPLKRKRPLASGELGLPAGWMLWPLLLIGAFAVATPLLPAPFVGLLAAYVAVSTTYTFWLKRKPVLDVLTLAVLYTGRIVAGAAAIAVPLSMWLLTFAMFFFLSLAFIKRANELTRVRSSSGATSGRGYVDSDLELVSSFGVASGIASVVVFALYVNDAKTASLYQTPQLLWAIVPVMLGWLMRAWLHAHRGAMNEDPILFAFRDRASVLAGLFVVIVILAAKVINT